MPPRDRSGGPARAGPGPGNAPAHAPRTPSMRKVGGVQPKQPPRPTGTARKRYQNEAPYMGVIKNPVLDEKTVRPEIGRSAFYAAYHPIAHLIARSRVTYEHANRSSEHPCCGTSDARRQVRRDRDNQRSARRVHRRVDRPSAGQRHCRYSAAVHGHLLSTGRSGITCAAATLAGWFFEQQDATCACAYRPYARPSPMCRPYIQARRFCEHSQAVNCDARRSDARTLAAPSESQCLDHWTTRLVCYVLPFA